MTRNKDNVPRCRRLKRYARRFLTTIIGCPMTPPKRKSKLADRIAAAEPPENIPHPWAEPSPDAKAAAEPAKTAVKAALSEIKSPAQADHVAAEVIAAAGGATEKQVR